MTSIKRNGVDMGVALSLASRRLLARRSTQPVATPPTDFVDAVLFSVEASSAPPRTTTMIRHHLKRILRRLARDTYRVARPFARPVLFRLREYFSSGIRHEMLSEFAKLQVQHSSSSISQEMLTELVKLQEQQLELQAEQQEYKAQVMQKLQRLTHLANAQSSLLQKFLSNQLSQEKAGPQLDRIEQYALLDVNRVAISSGPEETLVKTTVGYVLCDAKDHALLANLMEAGELEPGTRKLIERLVQPGDVFVDIGANIGMHTIAAARAMSGKGRIIAFEPFEPTRKLLERNLWLNGFSDISQISHYALSDSKRVDTLHLGATSGHHSLYELDTPSFTPNSSVEISTITLDEFLADPLQIKLLKIDAEGAEIDIVKGARQTILANPQMFMIVELGLAHLKRNSIALKDWIEHFTSLDLVFSVINEQTGELEDWSIEQLANTESVNLLFHRPNELKSEDATDAA